MTKKKQPETEAKKVNPLLERVNIPGEKFRVPSGGLFYTNGELDDSVKDGEIYAQPMNAMDELVLKSPDKLLSGEAVTELLQKCTPSVLKPGDLLAKDVDYLMMCLRMISYGPQIELTATHTCKDAKEQSYSIEIRPILQEAKPIDPTSLDSFNVTLDTGQVVQLHPPRFLSTVRLYQVFGDDSTDSAEEMGVQLLETIADMIQSVDDHTDSEDITEWLKKIRVGDVQVISEKIAELSDWGIDPIVTVKCKDCKKNMEVIVPVNPISFFT